MREISPTHIKRPSIKRPAALCLILIFIAAPHVASGSMRVRAFDPPTDRTTVRPNILWITAEDMSPDLGSYGDAYARTPNLDRLASQGSRFTNAFAVAPVCAPSRSAIITGMYATSTGAHHMRSLAVPPPYVRLFPEYLRAAGYYTTNNDKTDYNFDNTPGAYKTTWDENGKRAHWRNRPDKSQPFFSVFNLSVTHESRIRLSPDEFAKATSDLAPAERHDPQRAVLPPYYPDTPIVRNDWARYHDTITQMDKQVQSLLDALEADGLADSTIVFFFSDHGRGLPRAKRWLYDSGLRVPLIVRWRGVIAPGTIRDDLVSFTDLAPTMLRLAGVRVPPHMQGRVFLGERQGAPPPYVFAHRDRMDDAEDRIRAVSDGRHKYIRNFHPDRPYAQYIDYGEQMPTMQEWRKLNKADAVARAERIGSTGVSTPAQRLFFSAAKPPEELYDTTADPHEISNLAGSPAHEEKLHRMRAALDRWIRETNDLGALPEHILKERMRPGNRWAVTSSPVITVHDGAPGTTTITLSCSTEGASIAYTTEAGDSARWKLYSNPFALPADATLRVKASRLGYKDSEAVRRRFVAGDGRKF